MINLNLLPPEEKREILIKKRLTLVLIFETSALLFLVSISLIFLATKIYLLGEIDTQKIMVAAKEKEINSSAIGDFQQKIKSLNANLGEITSFYRGRVYFVGVLEKVSGLLPSGSYLTDISFRQEAARLKVAISGFAPNRDELLLFKESLEKDSNLTAVNFPPSDWVNPADINFSFSFEIK